MPVIVVPTSALQRPFIDRLYRVSRGMFGYLDMVNAVAVTAALLDVANGWL